MTAIHPVIEVNGVPGESIASTEAAADFIERHVAGTFDIEAATLIELLRSANTPELADDAGQAFRDWAESVGLLTEPSPDPEL